MPTVRGAAIITDGGHVRWELKILKMSSSTPMRIGVQVKKTNRKKEKNRKKKEKQTGKIHRKKNREYTGKKRLKMFLLHAYVHWSPGKKKPENLQRGKKRKKHKK